MDVHHEALLGRSGITGGAAWRDATVARWLGMRYEDWLCKPRDSRITDIAQWEIHWRVEALQAWEREQEQKQRQRPPAGGHGRGRRR